jgi:alpha-galactosidase
MILDFSQNNLFVVFEITKENNVALKHFSMLATVNNDKNADNCLVSDIHLCGDKPDDRFGAKHVGESGRMGLKYQKHNYYENEYGNKLEFLLSDGKINVVVHYQFYNGISAVRAWKTVTNISDDNIGLEYIPSFSYTGLCKENLKLFIPHNSWCGEADWEEISTEQVKRMTHSSKRVSVSNTDSWSSEEYLPMAAAASDSGALMWQIENNGAWHWEIGDIDNMLYLKMSGPNDQENSWYKELLPGESFESVKACVCAGDSFEAALGAMTQYRRKIFNNNKPNKKLPVIFNDYMHCLWADPTEGKMLPLIDRAAELGCEYYCMDAGWYADGTWWETVGEWKEEKKRFPNGIKKVFDYIKSKGMHPGIWLEIEVIGINCPILNEFNDDCFFVRHGKRVVNRGRYHLDFRNEKVRRFASDVVARVVEEYGAEYIKFDYNITPGVGTEVDADSFGDGLLEHNRAYLDWIREIKAKYPDLILENCSSGGLRMDYAMLAEHHLQSVTDQEDFKKMAHIAAAAPTAVLPEQSGIWVYPFASGSCDDVSVNVINGLLQRLYLSGQIHEMGNKELMLVKEGIDLYKSIRNEIPMSTPFYPMGIPNHNSNVICLGFNYSMCRRIALWCFDDADREITVPIEYNNAKIIYPSDTKITISHENNGLNVKIPAECTSVIIELN